MASLVNEILIHGRHLAGPFLIALDLLGTFVFALSGAAAGIKSRFDLFCLMVLAFAAGYAGGITRDLLIGAVPPAASSQITRNSAPCMVEGTPACFSLRWSGASCRWIHPFRWVRASVIITGRTIAKRFWAPVACVAAGAEA